MHLHLAHLYPATMSTYGDIGNITCLRQRAAWRGIETTVHNLEVGDEIPEHVDFYFFGGGQDTAQAWLGEDLLKHKGPRIRADVFNGTPLLCICGGYQLLGESYKPFGAKAIPGVGLFPVQTEASHDRMIGNLIIEADKLLGLRGGRTTLVGFENHSGKTTITEEYATPLGKVRSGHGNNGMDGSEGCVIGSAIGCYLHGSLLPKNPHLADWFLEKACFRIDPSFILTPLDDQLEWQAHDYIVGRYSKP